MELRIDVYHHFPHGSVDAKLDKLREDMEKVMAKLDDLTAAVAAEKTQIASVATLLTNLKQQLADILAGESLSPAAQAKVDQLFTDLAANTQALTDAINAGS